MVGAEQVNGKEQCDVGDRGGKEACVIPGMDGHRMISGHAEGEVIPRGEHRVGEGREPPVGGEYSMK